MLALHYNVLLKKIKYLRDEDFKNNIISSFYIKFATVRITSSEVRAGVLKCADELFVLPKILLILRAYKMARTVK